MSSYEDMLARLGRETAQKEQLVSSLAGAANTNPDDFARQIELAKAAKMSIDALPDYKEQAQQIKVLGTAGVERMWKDNPVVANWLTDENNAKVAFDQTKEMGLVENATRKLGFFASGATSDLLGGGIEGTGHIIDAAWRRAVSGAAKLVLPTPEGGGTIDESSLAPTGIGEGFQYVGKSIQDASKKYLEPTGPRSKADQVASGLGQAAGQIGLMLLPGGQPAAAALMFGQGAKQQKDKIDMDKASLQAPQSDQDWEVLTGGAITGVTEFVASKLMIKTPAAFALKSKLLDYSAKIALGATEEGIQEYSENVLQDLAHVAMTSPESKVAWNEAVDSGEIGAWVGGIMQGVINGALHIRTRGQQSAFKNLNDVAGAQKLRERSPDAFQNFADATASHLAATTDGAVNSVYIDANTFKQVLTDAGIKPESVAEALPSIGEQYAGAVETNGDIVIPMNEWIGKVAGTEVGNALYAHARSSAESLSMAESDAARGMAPEIQAQLEKFAASQLGNEEFKKSAKEVEKTLFDEIKSTGRYSDAASRVYAQLVRDFYVVQSAKMGINPLELYNQKPYKIVNEGEAALTQVNTDAAEFRNWYGNSVFKGADGMPVILYHGTSDNVQEFDLNHPNRKDTGWLGTGVYLTDSTDMADAYARQKKRKGEAAPNVMPLYAKLENPYMATDEDKARIKAGGKKAADAFTKQLKEAGHDGIIYQAAPDAREIVVFDTNAVKSAFNKAPTDANGLYKQSATLRSGKETLKKYGLDPKGTYKTRDIAAALEARQRDKWGAIAADDRSPQALTKIAKWMQTEVEFEMENPEKSGVGWYSEKFQRAVDIMGDIYPELKTDKSARDLMTALIAITSDGQKVVPNFAQAMDIYGNFRQGGATEGQFTTNRGHQRQASIDNNLQVLQRLYDQMGAEGLHEYLMQEKTISELKKIAKANGGEMKSDYQAHISMPMAAVEFGPKLGAFYANLMGAHGYLTMDRWWSRTFNRYRGTLLQAPTQQGLDRFKELLGKPEMSNDEAIAATVEYRNSYEAKNYKNGTEIEKAANTIYKAAFENLEDAPFNAKDRTFMLDAVNKAQQLLAKKGYNLSVADIQAILWYYEKRLYGDLGARQSADISYEDAARRVVASIAGQSAELALQNEQGQLPEDGGAAALGVPVGEEIYEGPAEGGVLNQKLQPTFYSALQRAFEGVKQGSMPADQWLKWLTSNQAKLGVKKEEIEATGLREYLELNGKEKLAKEQVVEFLKDNGVKVTETIRGDQDKYWNTVALALESGDSISGYHWDDQNEELLDRLDYRVEGISSIEDAADYIVKRTSDTDAEYAQYQLPGGTKYKELLLTLPPIENGDVLKYSVVKVEDGWEVRDQTGNAVSIHSTEERALSRAKDLDEKSVAQDRRVQGYQSPHWDEANVLAHIRFNERTDVDGKRVLFIEEVQSDWAQEGRKRGFFDGVGVKAALARTTEPLAEGEYTAAKDEAKAKAMEIAKERAASAGITDENVPGAMIGAMTDEQLFEFAGMTEKFNELQARGNEDFRQRFPGVVEGVPSAPFVKDTKAWVGLAIKRMIRYAAENRIDKIAFVNGQQSAERYNLAKQIDYIEYEKTGDNDYFIKAIDHTGRAAVTEYKQSPADLENLVGKEIAQKIVSNEGVREPGEPKTYGVLKNAELTVGGEGMKTFYDQIVPQVANDVLKKLGGGKVETVTLPAGESDPDTDALYEELSGEKAPAPQAREQLGFTITPEMRDAALAGQALFQNGGEQARGGFDPSKLTTILGEKADYSTFLHETAHFFLTMYGDMAGSADATPQMKADMQTILDWFGVPDLAAWNAMSLEEQRKYHEQFAYNYEIYLFEGKAPSTKMQSLFDKFTAWLKRVYKSIRDDLNAIYRQEHGEDLPILTGEVRDVMDRMLATDEQIKQAEKVRSMSPSFQSQEQAGVDDATWAAYQQMAQEATDAALHDLATASLRQMKWLENARSRIIRDIQRDARETRRAMQEEVAKEVNAMPEFAAQTALREAKDDTEKAAILDTYGFKSQADLKAKLAETGKKADLIRKITDQRMLEEHSDMYDKHSIQVAIERALHNEARARFIAVELRMLSKAQTPVRVMQEAAKQAARSILMNRTIGDLKEKAFVASEARAARQVMEALRKDDLPAAVSASRAQLLNNQLASQTLAIKSDFAKSMELFKKLFRKDDKLSGSRDMNFISVARAILSTYGLGKSENPPSFYLEKIKAYDPEFYAEIEPMITAHLQTAKPVTELTVAEFQDLSDQIAALWHLSGRLKKNEIDGKLVDRKEIVADLNAAIAPMLHGKERIGYDKAITEWQDTKMGLMGVKAALRRVESWVDAMDRGDLNGPFRKYIWNPISEAVTQFRTVKVDYIKKYLDIMQAEEGRLDEGSINAPEIGYTFKNKAELLHALLHTGNESNKRKLLLGRNWGALNEETNTLDTERWDRMIARMQNDGTLTKSDYDFAQKVWDLLEDMKAAAQKAHYQMYGFYFNEITANPVVTPFGTYRGGYVPAVSDPKLNTDQAVNNEKETEQGNNSYMFPTTGRGFTKGRVEYNKPLLLDLGFLPSHIDKVLRFTYIEPRVKEVGKLVKNREFGEMIDQLDPTVRKEMLMPWLQRTAMQAVQTPSKGELGRRLDKLFTELRTRTGMQAMVGNFVNAIQQFTGFSIAALKVKPKYLKMATVMYAKDPKGTANAVSEASAYMRTRMNSQMFEMTKTIDQLLINPTKYDKLRQFAEKNGYFLQQGTQNIVDTIVWTGAYNEAVESGMDQKDAVRAADAAVRQTQGSFSPEDVSRAESGTAFVRMFLMFYSYFNMQANLLGTEFNKVARELGVRKGAGKLFYIYAMGFMIPAVMSEMLVQAAGGFDDGDDDEYDWTDALRLFIGSQFRSAAAMIPGIGSVLNAGVNMWNDKVYDDRISASPVITNLEGAVRAPVSLYQAIAEDKSWKKASRDVLTMLGLITRLPLGQVAKPVGYAADVAQGKINPESPADVARGLISGKDVNRKE